MLEVIADWDNLCAPGNPGFPVYASRPCRPASATAHVRVVMTSAVIHSSGPAPRTFSEGADGVLGKPFSKQELLDLVTRFAYYASA